MDSTVQPGVQSRHIDAVSRSAASRRVPTRRTTSYRNRVSSFQSDPRFGITSTLEMPGSASVRVGQNRGLRTSSSSCRLRARDAAVELVARELRRGPVQLHGGGPRVEQLAVAHVADEERSAVAEDAAAPGEDAQEVRGIRKVLND